MSSKEKVAILGGGVGSMAAAWALTSDPACREKYDITVYQTGFRIGGKGACGRNADEHFRIEEHGPHVWFGFYWDAFRMMREVLAECQANGLTGNTPFTDFASSFTPNYHATTMEMYEDKWTDWHLDFPQMPGAPGIGSPATLWEAIRLGIAWLRQQFREFDKQFHAIAQQLRKHGWLEIRDFWGEAERIAALIIDPLRTNEPHHVNLLQSLVEEFQRFLHSEMDRLGLSQPLTDLGEVVRRQGILLDTFAALIRGVLADDVFNKGFEQLDDQDFSKWLQSHGCRYPWSPPIQAVYDAAFAFKRGITWRVPGEPGEAGDRDLAAGSALHASLRMYFAYQGAYCYKMNGGMGDTIFAPIYLALMQRGVNFKFFHEVTELHTQAGTKVIGSIDFSVQAHVKDGKSYDPLIHVPWGDGSKSLPSWPNHPDFDQLDEGDELRAKKIDLEEAHTNWPGTPLTLNYGVDFDRIVLGISVGGLDALTKSLRKENQQWADMVDNVHTVKTLSVQLWFKQTASEMGWIEPDVDGETALVGGFVQPLDTWSDMSQTLPCERWPMPPRSVAYLCGPLASPDEATFALPAINVKTYALAFFQIGARAIWPKAFKGPNPNDFDYNLLVAPDDAEGDDRLMHQYFRANAAGSERYVLSVAGKQKYRLAPDWFGYRNLVLAGDWTKNWLSAGCVEAAVVSGKLAARALGAEVVIPVQDAEDRRTNRKGASS